jgi:phage terminase small subunit
VANARVPNERKRRLGNPGKRTLPSDNVIALAPVVGQVITAPASGDELIGALLESAASAWIALPDRLALLELVREGWDRRRRLQAYVLEHGESYRSQTVETRRDGTTIETGERFYRRPEAVELELLEKRLTGWLSLLGLTPSDRSRLGVAEVKAKSRLTELRERRQDRRHAS